MTRETDKNDDGRTEENNHANIVARQLALADDDDLEAEGDHDE